MTERKLQADVIACLKLLAKRGEPIWWLKIHGGPMQRAGIPDIVVVYRGRHYWIELKAPGETPTALQEHTMRRIVQAGGKAAVATTVDEFFTIIEAAP